MIELPHLDSIRFVKELLEKKDKYILVNCSFPFIPTIGMVCEASAQACAAFSQEEKAKIGFLVSLKNVEKLHELIKTDFLIKVQNIFISGNISEYKFELKDDKIIYVQGYLTIVLQK